MLSKFKIKGHPIFDRFSTWELGGITTIIGNNGTGKSIFLDFIKFIFENTIPPRLSSFIDNHTVSIEANFESPVKGSIPVLYRKDAIPKGNGNRKQILSWINGSPFSGDTETAVGHRVIKIDPEGLFRPDDRKWVSLLCDILTGKDRISKTNQIETLKSVVNRHSAEILPSLGKIQIDSQGRIFYQQHEKPVRSLSEMTLSDGERHLAILLLILCVALELSSAGPTILLLDSPFCVLPLDMAQHLSLILSSLVSSNLQIVLASTPSPVVDSLKADSIIRLTRSDTNSTSIFTADDLVVETSRRQPHALSIIQCIIESYKTGTEDLFIDNVLKPGLLAMGCRGVHRIKTHGPGEFGIDIGPFTVAGPFGRQVFAGLQAKVGNIHSKSGKTHLSVETLITEIRKALDHPFVDKSTNIRRRLDYVIAATSGYLTDEARTRFYDAFDGNHQVILWEAQDLAEQLWKTNFRPQPFVINA